MSLVRSWLPYALAVGLMILAIAQTRQILALKAQATSSSATIQHLTESNALLSLRVVNLEARDPSYASSKLLVAWDSYQHRGVYSVENLPVAPAGYDYQLWVLDPKALAPFNAGLVRFQNGDHVFTSPPIGTRNPGFALSLEPAGGSNEPSDTILFAVAPGQ